MMPDLGKYASEVYMAYAATAGLLVLLIGMTLIKSRRVSAQLREMEAQRAAKKDADTNG